MGDELAVEVTGLHKRFGRVHALRGLDLAVRPGEVHGFLGPNGAGKSTTIRVLLGLVRGDAGQVRVLGGDPWRDVVPIHRRLAYVPGDVALWPRLTGGEAIDLLGHLHGGMDERRRAELLERFRLDPTRRGPTYSRGNRQKVALVAALAAEVDLLVLDEPTSGLDPLMEAVFTEEIRAAVARGTSVLLSSHLLSEVEALADRVTIIRDGRVVEAGVLGDMRLRQRTTVRATLRAPDATAGGGPDLAGLARAGGLDDLHLDGPHLVATVAADDLNRATAALARLDLAQLTVTPISLEELFARHYEERGA